MSSAAPDPLVSIERVDCSLDSDAFIQGGALEFPSADRLDATYSFPVQGWIVGKKLSAIAVSVMDDYGARLRMPVCIARPDVVASETGSGWPQSCGFASRVSVLELGRRFRVCLVAQFEEAKHSNIAVIEGTRRSLPAQASTKFQPIMVTTLGRSGSTWLLSLLAEHPEIMVFQPQRNETRAASYFADVLRTLSRPSSYILALRGYAVPNWIGMNTARPLDQYERDPEIMDWLGRTYIEELIAFVAKRIDSFYDRICAQEGKEGATRFAEMCSPRGSQAILSEIYPGAREILLVRDFRDYLCSTRSWGHGWRQTRAQYSSEEEWIKESVASQVRALLACRRERPEALLVRYEDLVTRTEETLESILAHLGVDSSPTAASSVIDRALANSDEAISRGNQTSGSPTESIGRWRRELDPPLVRACEEAFGPALAELGYA
jgi:Sulfotransferase family